jgi:NAD-dependent dihydropyrimidine dehydrogenase PreA subunit
MATKDAYERLGEHLSRLGMGYPYRDDLITILKENFTPLEAKVAFALPNGLIPLQPVGVDEILSRVDLPREELVDTLESLSKRGLIFAGETKEGEKGYALHQVGFGFPQSFFWKGEETAKASKMAPLLTKYFNREVTREAFSPSETKAYRYIPVKRTIDPEKQGVYPYHMMEKVIEDAKQIALAHCPCRMIFGLRGGECKHPKEVCMKFNDMARYVIEKGFAKEITKEEALEVIKVSEEAGLVHFVDNAEGDIQHNCNCCGCACWNVGNIRRRKVPRDVLMATYFLRETDEDACIGCGACVEICPVDALELDGDVPVVDEEWCIGCGVCDTVCPSEAIAMKTRPDRTDRLPAANFAELHEKILEEKRGK